MIHNIYKRQSKYFIVRPLIAAKKENFFSIVYRMGSTSRKIKLF